MGQLVVIPVASLLTVLYGTWDTKNITILVVSHLIHYAGMSICLHRYFSHRSFRTSRWFQFVLGFWGYLAGQGGPLFWAGIHRHHHRHCDLEPDYHSPNPSSFRNFLKSHYLWMLDPEVWEKEKYRANVRDFEKYPELVLFDQTEMLQFLTIIPAMWFIGGWELLGFGFFLPKFTSFNCTSLVNSANHLWGYSIDGSRREGCEARNLSWTLIVQLGDNWHANHHHYPTSASTRLRRWEIDPMYGVIWLMEKTRLIWGVKLYPPPSGAYDST